MVGFTSVTFRKLNVSEIIELALKSGAECIEWGGDVHVTDVETAKQVRKACEDAGIAVNSFGSYFRLLDNSVHEFNRQCEIADALGAHTVRIWAGSKSSAHTDDAGFIKLVEQSRDISEIAQEFGLEIGLEFHSGTYNDTPESCLSLIKSVGRDNFKTYWQPQYHTNDLKKLEVVLPYTINAHIFYWDIMGTRKRLLADGYKTVESFVRMLNDGGFSGDYILEFVRGDSTESLINDMRTLKEICDRLGATM